MSNEHALDKQYESASITDTDTETGGSSPSLTRRSVLALGSASMATVAGCSMFGGGGDNENNTSANATATGTAVPDAVGDALFSSVSIEQGTLSVELTESAKSKVSRLSLIGPVTGKGDSAEKGIYPGIENIENEMSKKTQQNSETVNTNRSTGPLLQPNEVPRSPVFSTKSISDDVTATYTLLEEQFGPETQNYRSGIYYLVALGSDGIVGQRRMSLVPILTLIGASMGDGGELVVSLKNTGTGPAYPAYGTVIGAQNRNRGQATRLSGGNGVTTDTFILGSTQERKYTITPQPDSRADSPFSYPRSNSTAGMKNAEFEDEASAYCTGTGSFSHGLAVILGLVSGGYVGLRLSLTTGGEAELVEGDPNDTILCTSLSVSSSLPRQFTPVRWPGGRDELLDSNNETGQNLTTGTGNATPVNEKTAITEVLTESEATNETAVSETTTASE